MSEPGANARPRVISYSQRFEDLHLIRAFGGRESGYYIDAGGGHPVFDNVTFALYLRGWRGIAIEPNARLAALQRAVRPRDHVVEALAGAQAGNAAFHLVEDYHGFSTMLADNAAAALSEFGKASNTQDMEVTTLAALCVKYDAPPIDILKVDVEGAEKDVLAGHDWERYRPKVIVLEALAPFTQAPAWDEWEPMLLERNYRYALFDSLNRYYVAAEETAIFDALHAAPEKYDNTILFRDFGKAAEDASHPDHVFAVLLRELPAENLPLLPAAQIAEALLRAVPAADRDRVARETRHAALFTIAGESPAGTLRDAIAAYAASETYRLAAGRIAASTAW